MGEEDLLSLLIHIASCTETTFSYIDIETSSTILSAIFHKLYPFFPYNEILYEIHTKCFLNYYDKKIYIADDQLFLVMILNSIRMYMETCNTRSTEIPDSIIRSILICLSIEKRHSALLLKTLKYILIKKESVDSLLCEQIINVMQKIALSPLHGFKKQAYNISQIVIPFCPNHKKRVLSNINLIPVRGLETVDIANLYNEEYVKDNLEKIVKKICYLFRNNLENKDGECLYKRLLYFYTFKAWKEEIWPYFLPYLQKIDDSG